MSSAGVSVKLKIELLYLGTENIRETLALHKQTKPTNYTFHSSASASDTYNQTRLEYVFRQKVRGEFI